MRDATSAQSTEAVSAARLGLGALLAFSLFACLAFVPSARAAITHIEEKNIPFTNASHMTVDEGTNSLYVTEAASFGQPGKIHKFDTDGDPSNFATLGSNVLTLQGNSGTVQIAVDNSGGQNDGVLYIARGSQSGTGQYEVYARNGDFIGEIFESSHEVLTNFGDAPASP